MSKQGTQFIASNGEYRNPLFGGQHIGETPEQRATRLHWAEAAIEHERMSVREDNGGPAFPLTFDPNNATNVPSGMSLRDYAAIRAMQGEIAASGNHSKRPDPTELSQWAYGVADAMLAAREDAPAADPVRDAAPDLLAALIYLRDCIESGREPGMGDVLRAINKATGGVS